MKPTDPRLAATRRGARPFTSAASLRPISAWFVLLLAAATLVSLSGEAAAQQADQPRAKNVLFILADDLGYMDIEPFNPDSFYETPNLQRLADTGVRFTDGYAANPVCSPTRFSIMSGRYPSRHNATDWFCGRRTGTFRHAEYNCEMPLEEFTVAEAFKEAGYTTYFAGKWHLGPTAEYWPENQGFDINKGGWSRGAPNRAGEGNGFFSPYNNPRLEDGPEGEYLPYRLAEETNAFIDDHGDEPFFAFLSFYEVHNPKQAPEELVQKYREKRERLGLDDVEEFETIEQVWPDANPRRERIVQGLPVYAAMVEAMDIAIGRVLDHLEARGLADDTLIVFMSDNGGLSTSEGHNTANRPLRGGKGWLYEGGIREPMLMRWPGVTEAGTSIDTPVTSTDFYPTLLDAAGLEPRPDQHRDGVSLVPLLKGEQLDRGAIYWHYPHYSNQGGFPGGAVRMGDWKLIERFEDGTVHLYNLREDLGEQHDLAGDHPDRVNQMRAKLHDWYEQVDARFLRAKEDGPEPWRPGNDN